MKQRECARCGTILPEPGPTGGRPRRFCGNGCKKLHELEIQRLSQRLDQLDAQRRSRRRSIATGIGQAAHHQKIIGLIDAEVAEVEARVRELHDVDTIEEVEA